MTNPHLVFEFQGDRSEIQPITFQNPVKVLQTRRVEEVPEIMERMEQEIEKGYYAAGYVSYEAAPGFQPEMQVRPGEEMPLVWFGIFKHPVLGEEAPVEQPYQISDWEMESSVVRYKEGIENIKKAIEEGHTYQVNYTERLHAKFTGSDWSFYRQLVRNQQAGYSAYLNLGKYRILSASPELFFRIDDGKLITKPMKGTAPRGRNASEDAGNAEKLVASEKERAENLMIVDLLRNDMSRIAASGSVEVSQLFEVETYPTVLQMTSTIEAELKPDLKVFDWFKALFPCGSITGAPKISTMQTIAELEQSPREVYCGAIGYITPEKNAMFSVPIRTVVIDSETGAARYGVGGGITWDSSPQGEFSELEAKAKVLTAERPEFSLLESLLLKDGEYPLVSYHLRRLRESGVYFGYPANIKEINRQLMELAKDFPEGTYKVRLLVDQAGNCKTEAQPVLPIAEPMTVALASFPVDSNNPFIYHKTTNRKVYEKAQKSAGETFSALLWNEKGELTEFTIGNLVVEKDGLFFTPPVNCGLLPGTLRQQLLDEGKITEQVIKKDSLKHWDAIWFVNSVRGWLKTENKAFETE